MEIPGAWHWRPKCWTKFRNWLSTARRRSSAVPMRAGGISSSTWRAARSGTGAPERAGGEATSSVRSPPSYLLLGYRSKTFENWAPVLLRHRVRFFLAGVVVLLEREDGLAPSLGQLVCDRVVILGL